VGEGKEVFTPMMMKIITGLLAAALTASFGWIIKIESHMTQVRADIEDLEDDVEDLESGIAEANLHNFNNRMDLTTVQGIVKSIDDKLDDVKRAIERMGSQ
jgi:hypothetical protein